MKRIPFILATLLAVTAFALWASGGFHTGWTQTRIPVNGVDEITGIEYTTYKEGFIAGLDLLAVGLGSALGIVGLSFAIPHLKKQNED